MARSRPVTPAPWTRPGTPRVTGRPSWIGGLRPATSVPPPRSPTIPPKRSLRPSDAAFRASALPPPMAMPRVSVPPPPSSSLVPSEREVALESEVIALREELGRLAVEIASVRARVVEESEPEIVRLALVVAERVVSRELTADPSLVVEWVREGIAALPGQKGLTVAISPDLAEAVPEEALAGLELVVDPALQPGSCEVREGTSVVPVGASDRIAAMSDALGVDSER